MHSTGGARRLAIEGYANIIYACYVLHLLLFEGIFFSQTIPTHLLTTYSSCLVNLSRDQNRRQKVFNRCLCVSAGGLYVCAGGLTF